MIKDTGMKFIKGLGRRVREIMVVAIIISVFYFPFKLFADYKIGEHINSQYHVMNTFTAEDEKILQDYFNITLVDNMELIYARFSSGRDSSMGIWYAVRGDINDLLEINSHFMLYDDYANMDDYAGIEKYINGDGKDLDNIITEKSGSLYYWEEGIKYMGI